MAILTKKEIKKIIKECIKESLENDQNKEYFDKLTQKGMTRSYAMSLALQLNPEVSKMLYDVVIEEKSNVYTVLKRLKTMYRTASGISRRNNLKNSIEHVKKDAKEIEEAIRMYEENMGKGNK